jgi:ABC-type phosphonate transport system ATPase subunit
LADCKPIFFSGSYRENDYISELDITVPKLVPGDLTGGGGPNAGGVSLRVADLSTVLVIGTEPPRIAVTGTLADGVVTASATGVLTDCIIVSSQVILGK